MGIKDIPKDIEELKKWSKVNYKQTDDKMTKLVDRLLK